MTYHLLAGFANYAVDIVAVLLILITAIVCLKKGFIRCLFGFVSTIVAIILAIFLTGPINDLTNGFFGLSEAVGNGMFSHILGFFIVFILLKVLTALLSKLLSSLVDKIPLVGKLNHGLGFVLGLAQGFLTVCGVVAILKVIPSASIYDFVNQTIFVKWLYNSNPLYSILAWLQTL